MDSKLDKLKQKIEQLTEQQHKIEQKYIDSVAKIVSDTVKKDVDIATLAGMILNAESIIKESPAKQEAWHVAGKKFLNNSKTKTLKPATNENIKAPKKV